MKDAEVKYSTVQNWYPADKNGKGGIYNFVTKRGICKGDNAALSDPGGNRQLAITWKYPVSTKTTPMLNFIPCGD